MFAGAAVAVSACADLVVEGAIDLVLLGTEDGCEVVGHDGSFVEVTAADEDKPEGEGKR